MPIQFARTAPSAPQRSDARARDWSTEWPRGSSRPAPAARALEFANLQEAYRGHGGIARGDVLASRMNATGRGGYIDLARRIVAGQLFTFKWHDSFWLPMFQFDPERLSLQEGPRRVLNELHATLDGWSISRWYVQPNPRLEGQRPLDLLDSDLCGVLAAAHARAMQ